MKEKNYKDNESTILFGVPRVGYGTYGGCTPYPICVKACSDYLGEDIEYFYFMVSCGAAFRLTWNCREWDLGNVDIYKSFPDPEGGYAYQLGAEALGREFYIQGRDSQTQKEDFIKFIKQHIDEGYPCVALGIIGPPEACIITGYKKQGEVLLGWNFFQNDEDFAADIKIEENGYFSNDTWWENSDTHAVMCIGPIKKERLGTKTILENAVRVMTGRREGDYYKGIAAYDAWKKMLGDPNEFHTGDMYSVFFPKYLCHSDAMNSLLDGRKNAARYFKYLSETEPEKKEEYLKLANQFHKTWKLSLDMQKVFEGAGMNETLKKFVDADVRKKGCDYIEKLRQSDKKCLQHLTELLNSL